MLIFDDSHATDQATDYAVTGHTPESGAGRIVSKMLAQALDEKRTYRVLRGGRLAMACLAKKMDVKKLNRMHPTAVGRKLGVDGVVRGKVTAFRQSWVGFLARAHVAFEAECFDGRTGKLVWAASAEARRIQGVEVDVALEACRGIAKEIVVKSPRLKPKRK